MLLRFIDSMFRFDINEQRQVFSSYYASLFANGCVHSFRKQNDSVILSMELWSDEYNQNLSPQPKSRRIFLFQYLTINEPKVAKAKRMRSGELMKMESCTDQCIFNTFFCSIR